MPTTRRTLGPIALLLMVGFQLHPVSAEDATIVFIGTYAEENAPGIFRFQMNNRTGELVSLGETSGVANPSFLALHPSGKYIYAVSEIADFSGKKTGAVAALSVGDVNNDYELQLLNKQPSAGDGPCYVTVDVTGRSVLVANYGGGSVAALPIDKDGKLKPPASSIQHQGSSVTERQAAAHAHSINIDANNRFAFAADLGLDKVLVYRFDPTKAELTEHEPAAVELKPGSGPRHFAFHPSGQFAFVNGELDMTVTVMAYDGQRGELKPVQTVSTLPEGVENDGSYSTAEVQVHPSGKFLYVSNRGHDTLAIFSVDTKSGMLTPVGHQPSGGKIPRNFGIHPSGKFVLSANQESGNVVVLEVDRETGELKTTGFEVNVPKPVCVKFLMVNQ